MKNFYKILALVLTLVVGLNTSVSAQCADEDPGDLNVAGMNFTLCVGDTVQVAQTGTPVTCSAFETCDLPDVILAIYTAPPTVAGDPSTDPNWSGFAFTTVNLTIANDGSLFQDNILGGMAGKVWFAPVTADSVPAAGGFTFLQVGNTCITTDLSDTFCITFLDDLAIDSLGVSCNAANNTVDVDLVNFNGGSDPFDGAGYTIGGDYTGTVAGGGTFSITGATPGSSNTIWVTDGNGCVDTFIFTVPAPPTMVTTVADPLCDSVTTLQHISGTGIEVGSFTITVNGDDFSATENAVFILNAAGEIVAQWPIGTFPNFASVVVSAGNLPVAEGPYDVLFLDVFGDGLQGLTCGGGTVDGSLVVDDGAGNIYTGIFPDDGACGGNTTAGNPQIAGIQMIALSIDSTCWGTFSGPGVIDSANGSGSFDASAAGSGNHVVQYTITDKRGCTLSAFDTVEVISCATCDSNGAIVINEIMFDPPESGADTLEYIEFYNNDANPVNMDDWTMLQGVTYTFPDTVIPPGGFIVICEDSVAFFNFFGVTCFEWSGALSNGGEDIILASCGGDTIDVVDYDDAAPWPKAADGGAGGVLSLCDPNTDNNDGSNWGLDGNLVGPHPAGVNVYASPGAANNCATCDTGSIVITEIMYNPHNNGSTFDSLEYIELYNSGANPVDLSFWAIGGVVLMFDGVVIPPGGYITICYDQAVFTSFFGTVCHQSWAGGSLSNGGETLTLCDCAGNINDVVGYDDVAPWPACDTLSPNGGGTSIILIDPALDNNDPANWCFSSTFAGATNDPAAPNAYGSPNSADMCWPDVVVADTVWICDGDSAMIPGGGWTSTAGTYGDTIINVAFACTDSINWRTVIVNNPTVDTQYVEICVGDSALLPDGSWTSSIGWYSDTLADANGCDSIIATSVAWDISCSFTFSILDPCMCKDNATTLLDGQFDELVSIAGPAGALVTIVGVSGLYDAASPAPPAAPILIPAGDTVMETGLNTGLYNLAGVHVDAIGYTITVNANLNGSDTMMTVSNLCYYPTPQLTSPTQYCVGTGMEAITSIATDGSGAATTGTTTYLVDGVANDSIDISAVDTFDVLISFDADSTDAANPGCVQAVTYTVYVVNEIRDSSAAVICPGDSVQVGSGAYVMAAGVYTDTLNSSGGCDSIVVVDVSLGATSQDTSIIVNCGQVQLPNGQLAQQTGFYYDSLSNSGGCDSIIVYDVTINFPVNAGMDTTFSICDTVSPINLYNYLPGANLGGTFVNGNGDTVTNIFDPSVTGVNGEIDYIVAGASPCPNDTAHLSITILNCPVGPCPDSVVLLSVLPINNSVGCVGDNLMLEALVYQNGAPVNVPGLMYTFTETTGLVTFNQGPQSDSTASHTLQNPKCSVTPLTYQVEVTAPCLGQGNSLIATVSIVVLPDILIAINQQVSNCLNGFVFEVYCNDAPLVLFDPTDPANAGITTNVVVMANDSMNNIYEGPITTSDTAVIIGTYTYLGNDFSPCLSNTILITDNFCPINVDFVDVYAGSNGCEAEVTWSTGTETNSDYFSIERSDDGINFVQIGTIAAAGNSASLIEYSFVDNAPLNGTNYYRIVEHALDGQTTTSDLVFAEATCEAISINQVYPNPAQSTLNINVGSANNGKVTVEVMNVVGQVVLSNTADVSIGGNTFSLDVSGLANAVYLIKVTNGENSVSEKFVKSN